MNEITNPLYSVVSRLVLPKLIAELEASAFMTVIKKWNGFYISQSHFAPEQ